MLVDAGLELVNHAYRRMQIDDEWSVRTERGFTWWPGELAQHIWADEPVEDDGFIIYGLHAETDFIAKNHFSERDLELLGAHGTYATMSAQILVEGGIRLASKVYVHDETLEMWQHVFPLVALLQVTTAYLDAATLCQLTGSTLAISQHPASGLRTERDDMLNIVKDVIAPMGREASAFAGADLLQARSVLSQGPSLLTNGDETGLTAEFPFQSFTSLFQMHADVPNPRLGNGLLMQLTPPMTWEAEGRGRQALLLNTRESGTFTRTHLLGSWCRDPSMTTSLTFVTFMPNAAYLPDIATTMALNAAGRSRWTLEELAGGSLEDSRKTASPQFGAFGPSAEK